MLRLATLSVAVAALATAAPAFAQDAMPASTGGEPTTGSVYGGILGGYHDLGDNVYGKDGGAIASAVLGFDVPVSGGPVVVGVEGNFTLGTGAIDDEYGVAARLGYKFPSGGIAYVRGGYQWVDIDLNNATGLNTNGLGLEDIAHDYIVGVGGEFPLGNPKVRLRVGVDTVSFDSIRPTAGLVVGF